MTDNDKATPRPWRLSDTPELFIAGPNGRPVAFAALYSRIDDNKGLGEGWLDMMERTAPERKRASDEKEANAALIVRAVNAFDDLVAALKSIAAQAETGTGILPIEKMARAAISKHAKKD